jgi:hypothetical protein
VEVDEHGYETETRRQPPPEMEQLKEHLWDILESIDRTSVLKQARQDIAIRLGRS